MPAARKRPRQNKNARYEVWAGYPHLTRPGTSSQYSNRKFEWADEAWEYALGLPVDNQHVTVNVTVWRASAGWQPAHVRQRRDGVWLGRGDVPLTAEQLADREMRL